MFHKISNLGMHTDGAASPNVGFPVLYHDSPTDLVSPLATHVPSNNSHMYGRDAWARIMIIPGLGAAMQKSS